MALPVDIKKPDPAFMHHPANDLPTLDSDGVTARLNVADMLGVSSPLQTSSATLYADIQLMAGAFLPVDDFYDERALFTLSGTIDIGSDSFNSGQSTIIWLGAKAVIKASNEVRFMLFGGDPMEGLRYMWWNSVEAWQVVTHFFAMLATSNWVTYLLEMSHQHRNCRARFQRLRPPLRNLPLRGYMN
ncbi:MAG: pirin-like C-terminal cupin domain-containing protein [Granulosicoccus sp.]